MFLLQCQYSSGELYSKKNYNQYTIFRKVSFTSLYATQTILRKVTLRVVTMFLYRITSLMEDFSDVMKIMNQHIRKRVINAHLRKSCIMKEYKPNDTSLFILNFDPTTYILFL